MSASNALPTTVRLTIDGRSVEVAPGSFVLGAARRLGIEVPTLCDHPDLEPAGACRLCIVEVTHPDWKGWKGLVTSCLYPVQVGLEVSTRSDAVVTARRGVLALLAARCPGSAPIRALAERYGAQAPGLREATDDDDCILCGLCTRVCESYATAAITTRGRGVDKRIGSFADAPPADCVGCGGCAMVCPTGVIKERRDGGGYHIWDRHFAAAICQVEAARCIGCGSCAEACPFGVARVAVGRGGSALALIPAEHCRGCGACVGACPTGAIEQQGHGIPSLVAKGTPVAASRSAEPSSAVIACQRSALARNHEGNALGQLVEVPCTGRVTVPLLLAQLCAGADGVLVLGRHERTCRLGGAEEQGRRQVARAAELLALLGIEPSRVAFEQPAPGAEGPRAAARAYAASNALRPPLVRPAGPPPPLDREDLDTALELVRWLGSVEARAAALAARGAGWLRMHGLPVAEGQRPGLFVGELPWLELLTADWTGPLRPLELARMALEVMRSGGLADAGLALDARSVDGAMRLSLDGAAASSEGPGNGTRAFDDWLCATAAALPRPPVAARVATDGSTVANALVAALGYEPVDVGPDPLPARFSFTRTERASAEERLRRAAAAGAVALMVGDLRAWLRSTLLVRPGSWRMSRVAPALGIQLAWASVAGRSLTRRGLEAPAQPVVATEVAR